MEKEKTLKLLEQGLERAYQIISQVSEAFQETWELNPGTGIRALLGSWNIRAVRHLLAIITLADERDLALVANVHYRQMFEIMLQIRYFLSASIDEQEALAEKISAWGCLDWLEKMKSLKDHDLINRGYQQMMEQLETYNPKLVVQIREERSKNWNWFGMSFSKLAHQVSKDGEDLKSAYHIISADLHGSWEVTLNVANPQPGVLDFRGYPDKATLYYWAAEVVDRASQLYLQTWNEVARSVGAPQVQMQDL